MISKIKSLLGIAQRAGFVVSGSNLIISEAAAIKGRRNKDWLVVLAQDALTATGEDVIKKCLSAGLTVVRIPVEKDELGLSIGKSERGYVMIKDSGIAGRILDLLEEMEVLPLDQS